MSPQIQELIEKIKAEGIQAAEQKAKEIEEQAKASAAKKIEEAEKKSQQMILSAQKEIEKLQESSRMALTQASRDMLLSLRKKIEELLGKVMQASVQDALSQEKLTAILEHVIVASVKEGQAVEVSLSDKDCTFLKNSFIGQLQKKIKTPVTFRSSQDIGKGFTISFDEGKSCFDFSDASLAAFLGKYLNTHVSEILKESAQEA